MLPATPVSDRPFVSVLICTRNRGEHVVASLRSVQADGYQNFELLILDQSDDDRTERAVADLSAKDARVKYVRLPLPGKPGALNRGLELALGEYILLTDDDCEVVPGWMGAMVDAFEREPRVGCVHGDVSAGPHDPTEGYIPICRIERSHTIFRLHDFAIMPKWSNFGIGANMALRRSAAQAIAGCDPCIGPGAKFRTGDDTDMGVQVLRRGYAMHFSAEASVIHHGFRLWKSAKQDVERSGFAQGAIFVKHLRCGTLYRGAVHGLWESASECLERAVRGQRPLGLTYPLSWVRGSLSALFHRVDPRTNQFVKLSDQQVHAFAHHVAEVVMPQDRARATDPAGSVAAPPKPS